MAYMDQKRKSLIAPKVKAALAKYKVKGSLSVSNHTSLVLTLKSGKIDFIKNYNDTVDVRDPTGNKRIAGAEGHLEVNPYHFNNHFTGKAKDFLIEVHEAMNNGNHDRSDIQTDYFDVGWYVRVSIGRWDKPYIIE